MLFLINTIVFICKIQVEEDFFFFFLNDNFFLKILLNIFHVCLKNGSLTTEHKVTRNDTHREVPTVERVDDEGLVTDVDHATNAVTRVEGCRGSWVVLDRPVVVTVLDLLQSKLM